MGTSKPYIGIFFTKISLDTKGKMSHLSKKLKEKILNFNYGVLKVNNAKNS